MTRFLPSLLMLGTVAVIALFVTTSRTPAPRGALARGAASKSLRAAIGIQIVHFIEEAVTGFHRQFGLFFGVPEMSSLEFVLVNVAFVGWWMVASRSLERGRSGAFFAAWFLAIAGVVNSLAHPLLALASNGYFPGLYSSPLIGVAAFRLSIALVEATDSKDQVRLL